MSKRSGRKDVQRRESSKNKKDNQNRFGLILNIGNLILKFSRISGKDFTIFCLLIVIAIFILREILGK